jgi:hypothetical protein
VTLNSTLLLSFAIALKFLLPAIAFQHLLHVTASGCNYSTKVMARCSPLNEVAAANVAEVDTLEGVEGATEVAWTVGGDEIPVASGEEGRVSSAGETDNSEDEGASDNENSWTYDFGASTIILGRIKDTMKKGYFTDGEARAPELRWYRSRIMTRMSFMRTSLLLVCECLRILRWLIFC